MDDFLTAVCPECAQSFMFMQESYVDYLLLCPHCETILMVTAVNPVQVDWAFEEPLDPESLQIWQQTAVARWHFRTRHR